MGILKVLKIFLWWANERESLQKWNLNLGNDLQVTNYMDHNKCPIRSMFLLWWRFNNLRERKFKRTCSRQLFWRFLKNATFQGRKLWNHQAISRIWVDFSIQKFLNTLLIGIKYTYWFNTFQMSQLMCVNYELWHPNIFDSTPHGFDH
jgi:hypothetical protein